MSFVNQTFNNQIDLFNHIKNDAISEGYVLKKDGDDNGNATRRVLILRDSLNQFDCCFMINVDVDGNFTFEGDIKIQTCINFDVNENFINQITGDDNNHVIAIRSKLKLNAVVSINSKRIFCHVNQNGWFQNFYVGSMEAYKITNINNENLVTLSNKMSSVGGNISMQRNGNFLEDANCYADSAWRLTDFATRNTFKISPSLNNTYTMFPIQIFQEDVNKVLGELDGVFLIGGTNTLTYSTFTLNTENYIILDLNDVNENYIAVKQ